MTEAQLTADGSLSDAVVALDALRRRGDFYGLLNIGLKHLAGQPDDAPAALLVSQAYAALGLMGPARELLGGLPAESQQHPEIDALRMQIARAPSGRVSWGALQGQYEANAARLFERYPALRAHEATFRDIPRQYELYRSADGNLHVAQRDANRQRRWLPDLRNVGGMLAAAQLPHEPPSHFCGVYLVAGDRMFGLFNRVFDATRKMFLTFSPRIYVIEEDVASFGVSLYVAEDVERLCHERAAVFVGPDCVEELLAFFEARPLRLPPEYAVRLTPAGEALAHRACVVLLEHTKREQARAAETVETVHQYYDALPADHWKQRFAGAHERPLRVMGMISRFTTFLQYSMRDWGAAFESRGHEFRVLTEDNDHDLLPVYRKAQVLDEYKPDLVVSIDHFRREYAPFVPDNIPCVGWIQDTLPHLYTRECGESLGPLDFYIANSLSELVTQYGYPRTHGLSWTVPTDERTYSAARLPEAELAPHRCDLSFVSNQSTPPQHFYEQRRQRFGEDPGVRRIIDYVYDALVRSFAEQPQTARNNAWWLLDRAREELGLAPASSEARDTLMRYYLQPLAELMFRQSTLEWVADYCDRTGRTLHLYGNGWDAHPRLARYARGAANNGRELRAIYQASAVNLQIFGAGSTLHQRLLDGLAAGGFFLIRYTPADMCHAPTQRALAALRECDLAVDTNYDPADVPQVAAAMQAMARHNGWEERPGPVRVPAISKQSWEDLEATGFRQITGAVFPEYGDVSFGSAAEFERRADHFLAEPAQREPIVTAMREVVVSRYSYGALVDDLLALVSGRLARQ